MGTTKKITDWITQRPKGEAFSTADVMAFGKRSALDQALCRMVKDGKLKRLARGIFIASTPNAECAEIDPIESALAVISRRNGYPIQVSGDVAIQQLGLSAKNLSPEASYLWPARPRKLTVMGQFVQIRSISPRKIALCGRTAGLAITAIWRIGKQKMTPTIMTTILNSLPHEERMAVQETVAALPAWAAEQLANIDNSRTAIPVVPTSDTSSQDVQITPLMRGLPSSSNILEHCGDTVSTPPSDAEKRWSGFGPYYAMFPVEFARQVVSTYCPPHGAVIDPFCGRGTVPFVALATGRAALGSDINPVAWVYAKTKTDPHPDPQAILRRARQIQGSITRADARPENDFQKLAWSKDVLAFLNAARRHLNWKQSRIDRTLMGILLVHLHDKLGSGFSNQMRQSKAMAPEYSVRWWREKQMFPPEIDMISALEQKLEWRYKKGIVAKADGISRPTILFGDSRIALRRSPTDFSADLILTSPPYYGVTNYRYDNWIRLWLLNEGPALPESDSWARHGNQEQYRDLLKQTFTVCKRKSRNEVAVYVRTDARKFTLETTVDVLKSVWPDKSLYFTFDGFKKATQTALFGDKGLKPGEVDLLLLPPHRQPPSTMQSIEGAAYPVLSKTIETK